MIRVRLEHALMEKRRLERDVARLQGELEKAHAMLQALSCADPNPHPSLVSDDGGSSLENNEEVQLEELYASLMGGDHDQWMELGVRV